MAVDTATVKRVARLARIAVTDFEAEGFRSDLNAILGFVEQLNQVDVSGVEPLTSILPMALVQRADVVDDGFVADKVVGNAPARHDDFFVVPKVVE